MKKKVLPFEIIFKVFDQISFSDRLVCQTVCKAWSRAASEGINKSLEIRGVSGVHFLASKLIESSENNMVNFSGVTVRRISILDTKSDSSTRLGILKNI